EDVVWDFPVGAILVKTFSYLTDARDPSKGERLLETRLLVHEPDGWTARTYVWNEAQTEARLERAGLVLATSFIDPSGNPVTNDYLVPGENDCRACHGKGDTTNTLGGKTLQLDRDHDYGAGPVNQIEHLASLGLFAAAPPPASARTRLVDPFGSAPIFDRVRSYFDGNCSHCHQPGDLPGSLSGFWLDFASTEPATNVPANWGICKQPTSAGGATCGRQLDVVPGAPDDSVLLCRLEATDPKVRMPPLGRTLVHAEGVALLREWVSGLPGGCGNPQQDAGPGDAGADASDSGPDARAGGDAGPSDAGPG
ncbi:MAG: hypothetical protein FJ104_16305, partial [Deltaproteobacteria bacterium]|nr:hypothetical protein [Deltaproteobacteria bacterium]